MNYMERRGSGFKKIKDDYHRAVNFRSELEPKFYSEAKSFWVILYNLNYSLPISKIGVGDKRQPFEGGKAVVSRKKQLFEGKETVVSKKKQSFEEKVNELCLSAHTKGRILQLYRQLGESTIFFRADVMKITGITSSPAGDLIPASNEPSAVLARAFGECREGHIPRCFAALQA